MWIVVEDSSPLNPGAIAAIVIGVIVFIIIIICICCCARPSRQDEWQVYTVPPSSYASSMGSSVPASSTMSDDALGRQVRALMQQK